LDVQFLKIAKAMSDAKKYLV